MRTEKLLKPRVFTRHLARDLTQTQFGKNYSHSAGELHSILLNMNEQDGQLILKVLRIVIMHSLTNILVIKIEKEHSLTMKGPQ